MHFSLRFYGGEVQIPFIFFHFVLGTNSLKNNDMYSTRSTVMQDIMASDGGNDYKLTHSHEPQLHNKGTNRESLRLDDADNVVPDTSEYCLVVDDDPVDCRILGPTEVWLSCFHKQLLAGNVHPDVDIAVGIAVPLDNKDEAPLLAG
ncbi:hypothetical protein PsorP6_008483 [Peronosclerospora sorghi]|uniref:Uncharacterized protein n=1 Tax=Peronosclerospora sorghi TaxID=230839 RepID=A0ACC0W6B7_9STRA|nr:hypothetical protein PsorP6_008483 [Peronosclerospora sorghi]